MSRWYRAYEGTVSDPKLAEAALIAGVSRSIAIAVWHGLLESAASSQDKGRFDTSPRRLAAVLGEALAPVEALFAAFDEIGLTAEGVVVAWSKRQYESDTSTNRSRKHRETQRNGDATLQQQHATPPETDTETDTETTETSSVVARKRATRLPDDWKPSEDQISAATRKGLNSSEIEREAEKFRNYWLAKGGKDATKLDWGLTWANWVMSAIERRPRQTTQSLGLDPSRPAANSIGPSVWVPLHSPGWDRWMDYHQRIGKPAPKASNGRQGMGWYFPTALPPGISPKPAKEEAA